MKLKTSLTALFLVLALSLASFAEETPKLQQVSKHVWAYVWPSKTVQNGNLFGANAGIIIGKKSVLVIDALTTAKEATRFLADIRKITDKPIKLVVNTHGHLDHAWGNCVFSKAGVQIMAQENASQSFKMAQYGLEHPEMFGLSAKDLEGTTAVQPTSWVGERATIELGGVHAAVHFFGHTHSPDSVVVDVPEDKVSFVGDLLFTAFHPFMGDGEFDNWKKQLSRMADRDGWSYIPGHGPLSTKKDLQDMSVYITKFDLLAKALCKGKKAEDAPELAKTLVKHLPEQGRVDASMVPMNLKMRYLPKPEGK